MSLPSTTFDYHLWWILGLNVFENSGLMYKLPFLWAWLVLVVQLICNMENLYCFYWKFRIVSSAKIYIIYISTIHAGFCNARNSSRSLSRYRGLIFSVPASWILWLSYVSSFSLYPVEVHVGMLQCHFHLYSIIGYFSVLNIMHPQFFLWSFRNTVYVIVF